MNVGNLCQRNLVTAGPFDDITVAARLMCEKHVGYVIVVEPDIRESAFKRSIRRERLIEHSRQP